MAVNEVAARLRGCPPRRYTATIGTGGISSGICIAWRIDAKRLMVRTCPPSSLPLPLPLQNPPPPPGGGWRHAPGCAPTRLPPTPPARLQPLLETCPQLRLNLLTLLEGQHRAVQEWEATHLHHGATAGGPSGAAAR